MAGKCPSIFGFSLILDGLAIAQENPTLQSQSHVLKGGKNSLKNTHNFMFVNAPPTQKKAGEGILRQ
jgi:hypothetical protein